MLRRIESSSESELSDSILSDIKTIKRKPKSSPSISNISSLKDKENLDPAVGIFAHGSGGDNTPKSKRKEKHVQQKSSPFNNLIIRKSQETTSLGKPSSADQQNLSEDGKYYVYFCSMFMFLAHVYDI